MKVDDFENIINDIEKRKENIRSIFERANINAKRVEGTDVWTSPAQREFSSKYEELSVNYDVIINALQNNISFLRNTLNSYKTLENTRNDDIQNNAVTLDVNS